MAFFNKNKESKEKRKGETKVGKIIYCFLLFAPLFSILFSCLYVVFNKNAYKSYGSLNIQKKTQTLELKQNLLYEMKWINNHTGQTNNSTIIIEYATLDVADVNENGKYFRFNDNGNITIQDANQTTIQTITPLDNDFTFTPTQNYNLAQQPWFISYSITSTTDKLDAVFEYSLTKVENSAVYNWAKDTGTYTVMETTTTGLGIDNTFLPMLLTYWLIVSVIYFIYDIALILIWALHRRIHELGDSI